MIAGAAAAALSGLLHVLSSPMGQPASDVAAPAVEPSRTVAHEHSGYVVDDAVSLEVRCPARTMVVSGGYRLLAVATDALVVVRENRPLFSVADEALGVGDGWRVQVSLEGQPGPWALEVWALCSNTSEDGRAGDTSTSR